MTTITLNTKYWWHSTQRWCVCS